LRTPEQANAMISRRYRALVVGFDWSLVQRGIERDAAENDRARTSPLQNRRILSR